MGVDAGESQSVIEEADGYSAYFSPYFVETNNGRYSKHYYAGTQRMASRVEFMPQGMGEEPQQPEQAEQPDSPEQASEMASGQTGLTDGSGNTNANDGNSSGGKQPSKEEKEAMREYQKLQQMEVAKVEASGGSESASGTEESEAVEPDLYYYHTDHLGSTTFITDRNGDIAQYLAYIPYGETFIEERNVAPYKFNGKELDQETGYYYYGARYYDPSTALWFGTDPLAHKYPMNSPYIYCNGNPVKYVDPDGREKIVSFYTDGEGLEAESQRSVDNKVIMKSADNYYDNANSVAIWAHGYNDGKAMITYKGHTRNDIVSYFEFDKFLTENSNVYVDHAAEQKTTLVILHSCETGKENGFAQQMSDKLDLLIVAPTENVSVDRNTSKEIGVKNGGGWNVFYRGKKLDSFNGTTQPIFKNPEQIIDKYVQQYEKLYGKE